MQPVQRIVLVLGCMALATVESQVYENFECVVPDTLAAGWCTPIMECAALIRLVATAAKPLPREWSDYLRSLHCEGYENGLPIVCCATHVTDSTDISTIYLTPTTPVTTTTPTTTTPTTTTPTTDAPPTDPPITTSTNPPPPTTPNNTNTQITLTSQPLVVSNRDDGTGFDSVVGHRNLRLLSLDQCGPILTQKISNGNATDLFEFPWMALLRYENRRTGELRFQCGGTLINEWYVLTAAHCVTGLMSRLVSVRLGEYDVSTAVDCQGWGEDRECADPVQDIAVAEIISHPSFNRPRFANDIALVRLAQPASMVPDSVRPICLPITEEIQATTPNRVTIAGWGLTENQNTSVRLLQASMPTRSNTFCQQAYSRLMRIQSTQMCAGGERGVDSCKGDSGGPLMYPASVRTAQMVQFGVISLGVDKCSSETHLPGIYTRVAHFMRWILDNMRD